MAQQTTSVVFEVDHDRCVSCLACVRVCPVDAIAVDGSAIEIVDDGCIRCGACVPACPHDAIDALGNLGLALEYADRGDAVLLLSPESEVYFHPSKPEQVVNACYRSGFAVVHRGVIGDELVADEYQRLWTQGGWGTMIRSTCPVVVETIRHDYPELVPFLAPVKTPAQAEIDYIRARYGADAPVVFVGPCLSGGGAKPDVVITLADLEKLFQARGVDVATEQQYFTRIPEERRRHLSTAGGMPLPVLADEPQASRRLRKYRRDLGQLEVIARAVVDDEIDLGFVDILPCEGCLDHPLMGPPEELFKRRSILESCEPPRSPAPILDPDVRVDVHTTFVPPEDSDRPSPLEIESVIDRVGRTADGRPWDCGACGFRTCERFAIAFLRGRATYRLCPPYQESRALKAQQEAATDELTGLATYRVLRDRLSNEVARSGRTGQSFAVLFADLDRFKQVNDQFGHEAGNRVLIAVAEVLRGVVRSTDVAARYGGDEFVVVLIGTDKSGANRVGEEVRRSVEDAGRSAGFPEGAVTVSVGVSGFEPASRAEPDVLEAADRALYRAKARGGNQVESD